jgi:hypothetical protein
MTDNNNNTMKNGKNPPERWSPELTTGESSLDDAACSQLREPLEAPRDGTFILGAFGWPWLVPAVWNSYDQEWVVCHMQSQEMDNGLNYRWLEMEREKALSLTGWLPVPSLPGGYVFRPANSGVRMAPAAGNLPDSPTP